MTRSVRAPSLPHCLQDGPWSEPPIPSSDRAMSTVDMLWRHMGERGIQGELQDRPRVVLLGASNLTRALPTVVELCRCMLDSPLEVVAALGHGRSYGMHSSLLARRLPGILQTGLWEMLAGRPPTPSFALITDIGNDLMYGVPPATIADWVDQCADRLQQHGAKVIITGLPLESIDSLSPVRFAIARSLLFPGHPMTIFDAKQRSAELHERLAELAVRRRAALIEQPAAWFGMDPIHLKRRCAVAAWSQILGPWVDASGRLPSVRGSLLRSLRLRRVAPEVRWWFGIPQRRAQPAAMLGDGTKVWMY